MNDIACFGVARPRRHPGAQPLGLVAMHQRLAVTTLLNAIFDRREAHFSLVLAAARNDRYTAQGFFIVVVGSHGLANGSVQESPFKRARIVAQMTHKKIPAEAGKIRG